MPYRCLSYRFQTKLPVGRPQAFRWATDYRSTDLQLGGINATRKVERLTTNLLLLTDSFGADPFSARRGARTVKKKLVHLYPAEWAWTSTHVSGPALYSQFLYKLNSRGPTACTLDFGGSQVERVVHMPSLSSLRRRALQLKREDSRLWARFAATLAQDPG